MHERITTSIVQKNYTNNNKERTNKPNALTTQVPL